MNISLAKQHYYRTILDYLDNRWILTLSPNINSLNAINAIFFIFFIIPFISFFSLSIIKNNKYRNYRNYRNYEFINYYHMHVLHNGKMSYVLFTWGIGLEFVKHSGDHTGTGI